MQSWELATCLLPSTSTSPVAFHDAIALHAMQNIFPATPRFREWRKAVIYTPFERKPRFHAFIVFRVLPDSLPVARGSTVRDTAHVVQQSALFYESASHTVLFRGAITCRVRANIPSHLLLQSVHAQDEKFQFHAFIVFRVLSNSWHIS